MASTSSDQASSHRASSDEASSTHTSDPTSSSNTSSNQPIVEFYLSSLWSFLPEGIKRVIEHFESVELEQGRFVWDEECDWFHIQCLEDDKDFIMNEYFKIQCELEDELKQKGVIEHGGSLMPTVENDLVGKLPYKTTISEDPAESLRSEGTGGSEGHANLRYPKGHSPVKNRNNRHPKGHGPVKNGNIQHPKGNGPMKTEGAEHVDVPCPKEPGSAKNINKQHPKGRGSGTKTGKCQAPQKRQYGY